MKKVISIVLAIIMAFSVSVTSFAVDEITKPGEVKVITVSPLEEKTYSFKATEKGLYVLRAKALDPEKVYVTVFHDSFRVASDRVIYRKNQESYKDILYFVADENSQFDILVSGYLVDADPFYYDDLDSHVTSEFVIEKCNIPQVAVGRNYYDGSEKYSLFVPEKSGYYNFRSSDNGNGDPIIWIYDVNGSLASNNDNGYDGDRNFDLTVNLEKGKSYAIYCYARESFSYEISYNKEIEVERLKVDITTMDLVSRPYFRGVKGDQEWWSVQIIPNGAASYKDLTVESSNEKVVSASFNEYGNLVADFKKPGMAKLTISAENGVSYQIPVVVITKSLFKIEDMMATTAIFAFYDTAIVLFFGFLFTFFPW